MEHPHVVDGHELWEGGGGVGVAGPLSAHGDVQDEEEGVVEGVGLAARDVVVDAVEGLVVKEPRDAAFVPIDREDMEFVCEGLSPWNAGPAARVIVLCPIRSVMDGAVDGVR